MSTPLKHSDPVDISDYLARNERDHANAEFEAVTSDQEGSRSPYAPKPPHLRSCKSPSEAGADLGGLSAYAPKRSRMPAAGDGLADTSAEPGVFASQTACSGQASFEEGAWNEASSEDSDLEETSPEEASLEETSPELACADAANPEDEASLCPEMTADTEPAEDLPRPDRAVSLQPGQAKYGTEDDPQAAPRENARRESRIDDQDLVRLEASVRWMQQRRQAAAMRLPRASGLPPLDLPLSDTMRGSSSHDRVGQTFRSTPRSLEPTRLAPPPLHTDRNPNLWLAVAVACILVAGGLYALTLMGPSPDLQQPQASSSTEIVAVAPPVAKSALRAQAKAHVSEVGHLDQPAFGQGQDAQHQIEQSPEPASAPIPAQPAPVQELQSASAAPPQSLAMVPLQVAAPVQQAPVAAPPKPARTLDPEEISLLMKQGEKFIALGDVVTARTMFKRAADAGDATGALALGASYDPTVLGRLGVMGMGADVEKARAWYRTAESLGSAEAKNRLQLLSQR